MDFINIFTDVCIDLFLSFFLYILTFGRRDLREAAAAALEGKAVLHNVNVPNVRVNNVYKRLQALLLSRQNLSVTH